MADWAKIRKEYIKGGVSYRKLSEKYGVPLGSLKRVGSKEKWASLRDQAAAKTGQKLVQSISDKNADLGVRLYAATERLLAMVEKAIEELNITLVTNTKKEKIIEYNNAQRPDKPTKEVTTETEEVVLAETIVDRAGVKAIASALRDIKEIQDIRSEKDLEEQEARIAKLRMEAERKDEKEDSGVEVVLSGEIEGYCK